jgi:hypothetical protein
MDDKTERIKEAKFSVGVILFAVIAAVVLLWALGLFQSPHAP